MLYKISLTKWTCHFDKLFKHSNNEFLVYFQNVISWTEQQRKSFRSCRLDERRFDQNSLRRHYPIHMLRWRSYFVFCFVNFNLTSSKFNLNCVIKPEFLGNLLEYVVRGSTVMGGKSHVWVGFPVPTFAHAVHETNNLEQPSFLQHISYFFIDELKI